ncbi:MAG TPA: hypothetical protein VEU77_12015 [Candidatus Acidoferrales bacterium]|nr:hypothetical protein [Candidatus Acidoferrales bacterium]
MTAERQPRMIRTIVCAFSKDEMPADDVQIFRRFEASVARGGWNIRVRFDPIEALPERYDVLVVNAPYKERAEAIESDVILIVTTRATVGPACEQLMREIERGDVLTAERRDPNAPKIVKHRGIEIL